MLATLHLQSATLSEDKHSARRREGKAGCMHVRICVRVCSGRQIMCVDLCAKSLDHILLLQSVSVSNLRLLTDLSYSRNFLLKCRWTCSIRSWVLSPIC